MANTNKTTERKPLTEEQKKAAAERMRRARAAKKAAETITGGVGTSETISAAETQTMAETVTVPNDQIGEPVKGTPLYDEATVQRMIAQALAKQAENAKPQIIQVMADTEKVTLRWQAPVASYNVLLIGEGGIYGRITGPTGTCYVPKSDFSRVLDEQMRWYIENRWMLVVGGLNDEEREALNCLYKEGETLDKEAFAKMVDMGEEMLTIFPALCEPHKQMVVQRYAEAYDAGNPHVTRELVKKLNEMSKKGYENVPDADPHKRGLFVNILEKMNADDVR